MGQGYGGDKGMEGTRVRKWTRACGDMGMEGTSA